jgi:hypothetical protein
MTTPLFDADRVARDMAPEYLRLLNEPTWENAYRAAVAELYRKLRAVEALTLMHAAQRAIVNEASERHGIAKTEILKLLQAIAQDWGLATIDMSGIPSPMGPARADATATNDLLLRMLQQGK